MGIGRKISKEELEQREGLNKKQEEKEEIFSPEDPKYDFDDIVLPERV